jgi:glutaredoxin-like protein NrdH
MVELYTLPNCTQCYATKLYLEANDKAYVELPLESPEHLATVKSWGYLAAPVVRNKETGEHWSGFRPEKLLEL